MSEDLVETFRMRCHWRSCEQVVRRRMQLKVLVRMSKRVVGYERGDVRELGRFRSQKLFARGNVEEEIANGNRRPWRHSCVFNLEQFASGDLDSCADAVIWLSGFQRQA